MNPESSSHKQAMVRLGGLNRVAASREMNKRAIALYIRFRKRFLNSDRGQALVELAFALPVLLALVYGVFSIGMGMIVYEQLGEAAFAGDRQVIVHWSACGRCLLDHDRLGDARVDLLRVGDNAGQWCSGYIISVPIPSSSADRRQ